MAGFHTDIKNMGALQNLIGGGRLESIHGGAWGGLKFC